MVAEVVAHRMVAEVEVAVTQAVVAVTQAAVAVTQAAVGTAKINRPEIESPA
jgi:hypothetical protein